MRDYGAGKKPNPRTYSTYVAELFIDAAAMGVRNLYCVAPDELPLVMGCYLMNAEARELKGSAVSAQG